MASLEFVIIVIAIIIFAAIFVPILLDDNGAGFISNSLCIIFGNVAGNYTCNDTISNVTFTGINGITIIPTNGSTIYWNFTGTQVNGSAIMMFHPLGGDADVFESQGIFDSYWRGITGGDQINVTERPTDILITLEPCQDKELLVYNSTIGGYQCITGQDFSSQVGIDPDEIMYPFLAGTSTGSQVVLSFTNYDTRAVREPGNGGTPTSLTWKWPVPTNFDSTSSIEFKLYWITQTASAGTVCHNISAMGIAPTENVNGAFGSTSQICTSNPGANILVESSFTLTPAQHGLVPNDVAFLKTVRDQGFVSDTLTDNAYILVGKMRWNP